MMNDCWHVKIWKPIFRIHEYRVFLIDATEMLANCSYNMKFENSSGECELQHIAIDKQRPIGNNVNNASNETGSS